MKTALQEAIEAVEKHMEAMTGEWADVYGIVIEAAKQAQQPRQELMPELLDYLERTEASARFIISQTQVLRAKVWPEPPKEK